MAQRQRPRRQALAIKFCGMAAAVLISSPSSGHIINENCLGYERGAGESGPTRDRNAAVDLTQRQPMDPPHQPQMSVWLIPGQPVPILLPLPWILGL